MKKQIVVAIATRSIPLADGLETLLKTIPQIDRVEIIKTMENAAQRVADISPEFLILDLALAGKLAGTFLEKIIRLSPETQRVLLVDDVRYMNLKPQFAEAVLVKGVSPIAMAATLINLLFVKGDNNEQSYR